MPARPGVPTALAPPRPGRFVAVALVVAAVLLGAGRIGLGDLLPSVPNPFEPTSIDRSQPALRKSLEDLSRYQAASANLSVVVDSEKDARFLPGFLRGERTVFAAAGSVDATVDFSGIADRAIAVSADRRSVTLTLPAPTLSEARVDLEQSRVVSRQRGFLDRVGSALSDNPTNDHDLYVAAQKKMAAAAANDGELRARAEANTRHMLESMLGSLGYDNVGVTFVAPAV